MSFGALVSIFSSLIGEYPESQVWADSPFSRMRDLPPGSKGVIGRDIASGLLQHYGFTPMAYKGQLRVNGQKILVRIAMKWENGILKFQNIRDVGFDHVLCFGLHPHSANAWFIPKSEIWEDGAIRRDKPGITSQHKGADAWIHVDPDNVEAWIQPFGGTIEEMIAVAKQVL